MPPKTRGGLCQTCGRGRGRGQTTTVLPLPSWGTRRSRRDVDKQYQGDGNSVVHRVVREASGSSSLLQSIEDRIQLGVKRAVSEILRNWEKPGEGLGLQCESQAIPDEQDRGVDVHLSEFLQCNPPQFDGISNKVEPEEFLDRCLMIGEALRCSQQRMVECAAFQLVGPARTWYRELKAARPSSAPPLRWEEFSNKFGERFIFEAVRIAKAREFEELKQTSNMTVEEYHRRFTYLAEFAPMLVAAEQDRVRRFVDGLVEPIFSAMVAAHLPTYGRAVSVAMRIEKRDMEERAQREQHKRTRSDAIEYEGGNQQHHKMRPQQQLQQQQQHRGGGPSGQGQRSLHGKGDSQLEGFKWDGQGGRGTYCHTCMQSHPGLCQQAALGACFGCGQVGHLRRDCPYAHQGVGHGARRGATQVMPFQTQVPAQPLPPPSGGRGRGGRGQGGFMGGGSSTQGYSS